MPLKCMLMNYTDRLQKQIFGGFAPLPPRNTLLLLTNLLMVVDLTLHITWKKSEGSRKSRKC